jgi:hypothetical protein
VARLTRIVIHPVLWAVYPILILVAYNIQTITPWMVYRPIVVSAIVAVLLFAVLWLILRNAQKAGLIVTLFEMLFFTYGHVFGILQDRQRLGMFFSRNIVLLTLWLFILIIGTIFILRSRRDLLSLTQALNLVGVVAVLLPIVQILNYEVKHPSLPSEVYGRSKTGLPLPADLSGLKPPTVGYLPDIYYIILDGYGRDDTLKNYINYDNSDFLNGLKKLNFYVARCSQSNYSATQFSLASSLNMNYLDGLGYDLNKGQDQNALNQLIYTNFVSRVLKQLGYQTVAVASGFSPTELDNADVYLSLNDHPGGGDYLGGINAFEALVMRTSMGELLYRDISILPPVVKSFLDTAYTEHRNAILFGFSALGKIPSLPGHKFVFVHILAPHEPFVFGPHGEVVGRQYPFSLNNDLETKDQNVYRQGYRDQVEYVSSRILPIVQNIIASSATPPVIIIQGDHGPLPRVSSENGRMTILNAYYFPGGGDKNLYPTVTPVNSFRLILNTYLGAQIKLLDDASYFFDTGNNEFRASPNVRQGCQVAGSGN